MTIVIESTTMPNYSFVAGTERSKGFTHILLITTGSVASIKAPLIVSELMTVSFFLTSM